MKASESATGLIPRWDIGSCFSVAETGAPMSAAQTDGFRTDVALSRGLLVPVPYLNLCLEQTLRTKYSRGPIDSRRRCSRLCVAAERRGEKAVGQAYRAGGQVSRGHLAATEIPMRPAPGGQRRSGIMR